MRRDRARLLALLLPLTGCSTQLVLDQAHYETPDERGIQVTQVLLRGADDPATPDGLDLVGYNAYRDTRGGSPAAIAILIPDWSRGSGWFDLLARDLVATTANLEVWSLNRRQVFLNRKPELSKAPWLHSWGLDLSLRDLARVVERARTRAQRVLLFGWGDGGGMQALCYTARHNAPGASATGSIDGLVLYDASIGWSNARERRFLEEAMVYVRHRARNGELAAFALNPRIKAQVPEELLFIESAALAAEEEPGAPSPLAEHHPALQARPARWTNLAVFGWAFDREPEASAWRGPLAGLVGLPFGALIDESQPDDSPPLMRFANAGPATDPYSTAAVLTPFRSPGGPFEYYPPLAFWLDVYRLYERDFRDAELGIPGWDGLDTPMLYLASEELMGFWSHLGIECDGATPPPAIAELGTRVAGEDAFRFGPLPGDDAAPLLLDRPRAVALDRITAWMANLPAADA